MNKDQIFLFILFSYIAIATTLTGIGAITMINLYLYISSAMFSILAISIIIMLIINFSLEETKDEE